MTRKKISVICPCFNERDNLHDCHAAVTSLFAGPLRAYNYELVFCDNASTDGGPEILREIAAADVRVKVILNARNFGGACSAFNGLMSVTDADAAVVLCSDLQDPPELIADFARDWEAGHEIVYGIRKVREEGYFLRKARHVYYRALARAAEIKIPTDVGDYQLIDRKVIEALRRYDDYFPYIRGMIAGCGFRATGVDYVWRARRKGITKNGLYQLVDQGLNGLISSSRLPMRLCMGFGFALSAFSILFAAAAFVGHLIRHGEAVPPGIPTLIVALFFFSGVQLFFFGVIGEYVGAIHAQVRKKPLVVERERINFGEGPDVVRRAA